MEDPGLPFHRDGRTPGAPSYPLTWTRTAPGRRPSTTPVQTWRWSRPRTSTRVVPRCQPPRGPSARLSRADHRHVVLEDDYDGEFRYDRQPVGALQGRAGPGGSRRLGAKRRTGLRLGLDAPRRRGTRVTQQRHADLGSEAAPSSRWPLADPHAYDRHVRATRLRSTVAAATCSPRVLARRRRQGCPRLDGPAVAARPPRQPRRAGHGGAGSGAGRRGCAGHRRGWRSDRPGRVGR